MGMETGAIKDEDITASSSFEHGNVGPHHGRYELQILVVETQLGLNYVGAVFVVLIMRV